MTMTEPAPSRTNGRKAANAEAALTDQVVLSGAGLASQGLGRIRQVVDGAISTVDSLVSGGFDVADQLVRSNIATELASASLGIARRSWALGVDTARRLAVDL